jgi:hypothetical protein
VKAVRPALPGASSAPQGPSPSTGRAGSRSLLPLASTASGTADSTDTSASLPAFGTMRTTFGSDSTSAAQRVA